ncbi:hypothetical protein KFK09_007311 [Dendrobium nobile]|uniref:Uncharacterized protein n=1 Tax=Dendrobium nobile TaxID=94219 RepID=A0A8T3BTR0_DENNO|nr:hypothetical protein KFK09_007311 [Dendrobium nobile]
MRISLIVESELISAPFFSVLPTRDGFMKSKLSPSLKVEAFSPRSLYSHEHRGRTFVSPPGSSIRGSQGFNAPNPSSPFLFVN